MGIPQILVVHPGEDEAAKVAEFRRERGLSDEHPARVMRVVCLAWPIGDERNK